MKKSAGFTLLEIMIALMVFAVLSSITASAMYYAFNTRARVNLQADKLNALQLALSILQRDIQQVSNRPIRDQNMQLVPALLGSSTMVEFTRDGMVNPGSVEKRATLKRLAVLCQNNALIRRSWPRLDSPNRQQFEDRVLLEDLQDCAISYLNAKKQWATAWHPTPQGEEKIKEPFPQAIQLEITFKDWGHMQLVFIIPEALYAKG